MRLMSLYTAPALFLERFLFIYLFFYDFSSLRFLSPEPSCQEGQEIRETGGSKKADGEGESQEAKKERVKDIFKGGTVPSCVRCP